MDCNELFTCSKCKLSFPRNYFYFRKNGITKSECKDCRSKYAKEKRAKDPEKAREYRRNQTYKKYGITKEIFDEMLIAQGGVCAICKENIIPSNHGRLCIDHNHLTNEVRGILCHDCNTGLGHFFDAPEIIEKAIAYLEKHQNV